MMQSMRPANRVGLVVEQRLVGLFRERNAARRQLDKAHDPLGRHPPIDLALHHAFDLHIGVEEHHLQQGIHRHIRAGILNGEIVIVQVIFTGVDDRGGLELVVGFDDILDVEQAH